MRSSIGERTQEGSASCFPLAFRVHGEGRPIGVLEVLEVDFEAGVTETLEDAESLG